MPILKWLGKAKVINHSQLKFAIALLVVVIIMNSVLPTVYAEEQTYYFSTTFNTGRNNGYSGENPLDLKDLHYGWELGRFVVSGYTRVVQDEQGNPVFLKNLGDKITLSFRLEQDIDELDGNKKLLINENKSGYDKFFEVDRTNFGRGALITRHTNYQNVHSDATYFNYLPALTTNANTIIDLFEEGDYEIALNYEVKNDGILFFNSYENYRIFFKFSVRNGNCMVFPFDMLTMSELANSSVTENGFYLDLARSRYLDIDVKKEVLLDGSDNLTSDIRFNQIAKSGDRFTDEGVYTITVKNRYTGDTAEKKIYVGTNSVLMAYMKTGYSISEILAQQELGYQITSDGTIIPPPSDSAIYPFDLGTKTLLSDKSFTENGFYLEFEESQHLDIIIIKEVLTNAADGLVEDTQFNSFAKGGDTYTTEGIYTIISMNRSSEQLTSLKICVGTNAVLKAYMITGYSITEINDQLALGAQITNDGDIVPPVPEPTSQPTPKPTESVSQINETSSINSTTDSNEDALFSKWNKGFAVPMLSGFAVLLFIVMASILLHRRRSTLKVSNSNNTDSIDTNVEDKPE